MGVRSFANNLSLLALAAHGSQAIRIIQSNDDGWAEANLRVFHDALIAADHDATISSPAENNSGKGKLAPSKPTTYCVTVRLHQHSLIWSTSRLQR